MPRSSLAEQLAIGFSCSDILTTQEFGPISDFRQDGVNFGTADARKR